MVVPAAAAMKRSLYVGDLHAMVNESHLYDLFSRVGPVVSVRVCRDQATQTSLGYAYVNFNSPHEAASARDSLNFTPLYGKPMRIMFSHRDPSMRKSGFANLFVKNLDASIDNKALQEKFVAFGNVLSCKVATDSRGHSKGYGFVQFDNDASAKNAIQSLNGTLINGKSIYVGLFVRRHERDSENGSRKFTNIYVKNFSETTTEEDLKNMFNKFGTITSAVVMKDARSRCFGFVNFESSDSAASAVDIMNGTSINGDKVLYVGRAQRKGEREAELVRKFEQERNNRFEKLQGANLYLKNLDDNVTDKNLEELFTEFGTITSCKIMTNPQGMSKGIGFVAFSTSEEATKALNAMNGKKVGRKPLYVAVAQRKEDRRAQFQAQFSQILRPAGLSPLHLGMPGFHPRAPPRISPPHMYFAHGNPGLLPPHHAGYAYQQQFMPGTRPSGPSNLTLFNYKSQRQGQRAGSSRGGNSQPVQQRQWILRNSDQGVKYMANGQNILDRPVVAQGSMPMSTLVSATPEDQKTLFPLVQHYEHERAGKVTGMLLQMDQTEVLHLIESPEALKEKIFEAMHVPSLAPLESEKSEHIGSWPVDG